MGNILTAGGRIKWCRVWIYVSPFVFANLVIWYWTLFMLPTNHCVAQIMNDREAKISVLSNENRQLKTKHRVLLSVAREKISFVQGQKAEMNRLLAHWHDRAVALEMIDAGLDLPTCEVGEPVMVGGWEPGTFSHLRKLEPLPPDGSKIEAPEEK